MKPRAGKKKPQPTYDGVAFEALAYEFPSTNRQETEDTIRQRLRRKKLGAYDGERVALLRELKDALQVEIGGCEKSRFFIARHGHYVEMEDFDVAALTQAMIERFSAIPAEEIRRFVPFCVFVYYLL